MVGGRRHDAITKLHGAYFGSGPMVFHRVAAAGHAVCTGSIGAQRFENLEVPPDGTCTLAGTQVDGTISVGGSVRIVQGSSATVDQVVVTGDLHLEANQRALSATRNRVGGSLQDGRGCGAMPPESLPAAGRRQPGRQPGGTVRKPCHSHVLAGDYRGAVPPAGQALA